MKALVASVVLLASACQSVAWNEPTSAETWRATALRESALAGVVATTEGGASEVYRRYEAVVTAMAGAGLGTPARPLLLVVEADDPLLCGDANTTQVTYTRWLDGPAPEAGRTRGGKELSPAEQAQMLDFALRMLAVRPPLDAPELGLPATWQQRFAWALVVPSDACLDTMFDRMMDFAMAKEGIGWARRLLMAPLMPIARSRACAEMQANVNRCMLTAALADRRDLDPMAIKTCLEALGLPESIVQGP